MKPLQALTFVLLLFSPVFGLSPFRKNGLPTFWNNDGSGGNYPGNPFNKNNANQDQFNPMEIVYQWKMLDFQYPSIEEHQYALETGKFVPQNNLPLGIATWRDRLFITMPRWKGGVPASLASLPIPPVEQSPPMVPYPDWSYHGNPEQPDCRLLMSVYRMQVDECGRLWVIDAGVVNATIKINPVCPPKVVVFDLITDTMVFLHEFPADQVLDGSLYTNILVDVRPGQCDDAYAYVPDVWRYGVVVVSMKLQRSWRTTSNLYLPTPPACDYNLGGVNFQWTDGVFGMTLLPVNEYQDRLMLYNPMSSYGEFMVSTSVLRNESIWANGGTLASAFVQIGSRGPQGQSSTAHVDRRNVMFYNLVQQNAVGCWDTAKPYGRGNLGIIARDNDTLIFPNDSKVDQEEQQSLWVISNRLPIYLYSQLDYSQINFRIQRVSVDIVTDTICDPSVPATMVPFSPLGYDQCY